MKPIFVTGIGTGIGKTVVSAVLTEALHADYWKPVQAGFEEGTDSLWISSLLTNTKSRVLPETYRLAFPASPHISAKKENLRIEIGRILQDYQKMDRERLLIIEGAGGLMVPLNENEFVIDLISALDARVILVSRNYLGSINHSLLTAAMCRSRGLDVTGWIFNDNYLHYEQEIADWSRYPVIGSLPQMESVNRQAVQEMALNLEKPLTHALLSGTRAE